MLTQLYSNLCLGLQNVVFHSYVPVKLLGIFFIAHIHSKYPVDLSNIEAVSVYWLQIITNLSCHNGKFIIFLTVCPSYHQFQDLTSNPTCSLMSCKTSKLIHKHNFDFLNLDIRMVYSKCLKSSFYPNIRYTCKTSVNTIPQTLFHPHEKQICNSPGEKIAVRYENYTRNIQKIEV
jgi:hypothetical protein